MQIQARHSNNRVEIQQKLDTLGVPYHKQAPSCVLTSLHKQQELNYITSLTAMQGTEWEIVCSTPAFWTAFTDIRIMGVLPQVSKMFQFVPHNQTPWRELSKTVRRISKAYACKIFLMSYKHLNHLSYLLHRTSLGVFAHLITLQDAYTTAMQIHKTPMQLLQKRRFFNGWGTINKKASPYPTDFFTTKQHKKTSKIISKQKLKFKVKISILKQQKYRTYFNLPKLTEMELDDIKHIVEMAHT